MFSPAPIPGTSEPSENSGVVDVTLCISDVGPDVQTLLCAVLIQVRDIWGNYQTCRCLLDSGSQASLVLKGWACEKKRPTCVFSV
ncbi:hypothetical protein NPIL_372971 [Nephila pilipes]|uniref:Uncharacterized protein n=1 Tax=Nephila pilipes TaxID=299642 RepID=A0A8X6MTI6_NEPPI|nr:hypothetical protein NPIL_372971 [Nephila pilipes]